MRDEDGGVRDDGGDYSQTREPKINKAGRQRRRRSSSFGLKASVQRPA